MISNDFPYTGALLLYYLFKFGPPKQRLFRHPRRPKMRAKIDTNRLRGYLEWSPNIYKSIKMKPWVLWRASGAPGGSRRAKREHQSYAFFVLLAPREPFWHPLGTQSSPWETTETSFWVWSRHKRLQKGGPGGGSETGSKKELESDPKWKDFKSLEP